MSNLIQKLSSARQKHDVWTGPNTSEENKAALSLFCELGISSQDQCCLETEVDHDLWRKKGKQIFSKIVRASKLTWQNTLQVKTLTSIVAAVDSICKKRQKTFPFTVGWQEQIKLCISSQRGEFFNNISIFSFQSFMIKLKKYTKTIIHLKLS